MVQPGFGLDDGERGDLGERSGDKSDGSLGASGATISPSAGVTHAVVAWEEHGEEPLPTANDSISCASIGDAPVLLWEEPLPTSNDSISCASIGDAPVLLCMSDLGTQYV
jgi:hypothetical protein